MELQHNQTGDGMTVYHVTTPKKFERYLRTGCILAPVRYWACRQSADRWARRTGRSVVVAFPEPAVSYPLPVGRGAKWSPTSVGVESFIQSGE